MNYKIIQITSGHGPAECCWVVAQILKKLITEAIQAGIEYDVLDRERGIENGTLRSAVLKLNGHAVDGFLENWVGTIQWKGQSKYRKYHKRKNWFIAVNLVAKTPHCPVLKKEEIRYEFTRSGGPGGQHVNKVSTAVRATHVPTGTSVFVSNGRSQLQNKKQAAQKLAELMNVKTLQLAKQHIKDEWVNHRELERGSPIRVFYGTDFKSDYRSKQYKSGRKKMKQDFHRRIDDETH